MDLNFSKDYVLENDFVKVSPLHIVHVKELIEISNEISVWKYLTENGRGNENLTLYIKSTINNRKSKQEYPFVVFDKIKKEFAGTTRFYDYSKELKTIKLGHTWYGEKFRGTGLNRHCKYLLLEFAFERLQVERVGFGVHAENEISIAAMKSIGCKSEGVLRNFIPSLDGKGRADIILLSILKNEWIEKGKTELKNKLTTNT